ncbi:MAG: hypothetical protein M1453_15360 [Acidobacteria bacterium]|nr:hypothetical protein [Acidobacteriota bacterium]
MKPATLRIVFLVVICLFTNSVGFAQCIPAPTGPGSLDTCFGIDGKVTADVNLGLSQWASAVAVQSDGKIVVAARADNYPSGTGSDFYVLRFDADGTLDPTFGSGGVARVSITDWYDSETPKTVAIQPDGRIIVAGSVPLSKPGTSLVSGFGIARLHPDGSIDYAFGTNGRVTFGFSTKKDAFLESIALQSNGYIVAAGRSETGFAFARLTPTGSLDIGFNSTGKVVIQTARSTDTAFTVAGAYGVAIQTVMVGGTPQEKIVAAGIRPSLKGVARDFAVLRLNPDGSLDLSFGSGGKVFTDFAGLSDQAFAVAIDANNNIIAAGHSHSSQGMRIALVRYTPSGQLDSGFGSGGKVTAGIAGYNQTVYAVALQVDGKILVGGYLENINDNYADFLVARFNSDGSSDTTFGSAGSGIVLTDFNGLRDYAWGGAVLQPDGRIVAVGGADMPNLIALARYLP